MIASVFKEEQEKTKKAEEVSEDTTKQIASILSDLIPDGSDPKKGNENKSNKQEVAVAAAVKLTVLLKKLPT